MPTLGNGRRVAIVTGLRTPFAKSGTTLKSLSAQDLGRAVVAELVQRSNLDGKEVDILVFGTVVPSVLAPNIAREVALLPMLPKGIPAVTVSRACASANQAITEPSTGETMGQSAEKMAKINHIPRDEQDQFALRSHRLAAAGTQDGRLAAEIMPFYVPPKYSEVATADNGVRTDTSFEQLQALKPVFDRKYGTVT